LVLTARLKVWWLKRLDNDSVRAWVPPYCAVWLTWALFALSALPPISTISETMGVPGYYVWVIIAIPANLAPIIGLWMRHGGSAIKDMSNRLLFWDWMGLILQATGHLVCHVLMLMFQASAWLAAWSYDGPSEYAGMTVFAASMLLPWTFGTLLLCAQCVRKFQRGLEIEREQ
jgi:hypothetical protein